MAEKWFKEEGGGFRRASGNRVTLKPRGISPVFSNISHTMIIILVNVLFFIAFFLLSYSLGGDSAVSLVALQPATILAGKNLWTFITSMFMHANFTHLFVNMISLMFIGSFVEKLIGRKRFLWIYFGSGIFAGIFFVFLSFILNSDLNVYAVGASGAIFGLGGLLAILTPRLPVLVFFIIPMPMWLAMIFLLVVLWALSFSLGIPIGNTAHLGGLIVGVAYGFYLKSKYPGKAKMIRDYFSN